MSVKSDIRDAIITICGSDNNATDIFAAVVNSVDIAGRSCSVTKISGEVECDFPNVSLMADVDDGQLIIPTIGSRVYVSNSRHIQKPIVGQFSEIDSALWVVGSSKFKISPTVQQFNDGSNGGLVKSAEVSSSDNKIINDIMTLKPLLAALVAAAAASPITPWEIAFNTAIAPMAAYTAQVLTPTIKTTFEDSKVTH